MNIFLPGSPLPVVQPGHGFTQGQPVYFNGTTWALAKADDVVTAADGVANVVDADFFEVLQSGPIGGLSGLTPGESYYLSRDTAGAVIPVGSLNAYSGGYVQRLYVALSATTALVSIAGQIVPEIVAYNARDTLGGVPVSTTPQLVPLDTEYFASPYFTIDTGGIRVVGIDGVFQLDFQLGIDFSASPGASDGAFSGWFQIDYNDGGGWREALPSRSSGFWNKNTDVFTLNGSWLVPLQDGAQIRLMAELTTATHTTEPDRSWISVTRLGPFATPVNPLNALQTPPPFWGTD